MTRRETECDIPELNEGLVKELLSKSAAVLLAQIGFEGTGFREFTFVGCIFVYCRFISKRSRHIGGCTRAVF